jgi:mannitol-1-/sugar-/sorbitol-6-phosphatase
MTQDGGQSATRPVAAPVVLECDAVLFDMDGTLVDSRAIVERTWLRWAAEHGIAPEAILAVAHGRRTLETMVLVAPHLATPEAAARLDAEEAEDEQGGETAVPGAIALAAALPLDRWAVVTSADRDIALRRIVSVGLPAPRILVGAHEVRAGKPDPEGYLAAAAQLGVAPSRCIVFEDTSPGVQAARAAAARVIGLRTTYPTLEACDLLVQDLSDVTLEPGTRDPLRLVIRPSCP